MEMSALRHSVIRHLTSHQAPQLSRLQRRWARVHDVRFVATQQAQDRILERYRSKLDQKAKQQGVNDINELKEVYKDKITTLRKKAAVPGATAPLKTGQAQTSAAASSPWPSPPPAPAQPSDHQSPLDQISPSSPNYKAPGVKTLSSFLDVTKTLDLPQREIEALWRLRHVGNPQSLTASIPASTFSTIYKTARKYPLFILPGLPRKNVDLVTEGESGVEDGAPIHFMQWTFPGPDTATVLFTHLAEYKLRGEYSQPHTTITHHMELSGPKGIVLCQGSVIENRGVSMDEGRWLVMCLQKFYNTYSDDVADEAAEGDVSKELNRKRRRLVEQFSDGSSAFRVDELLEEAERLG